MSLFTSNPCTWQIKDLSIKRTAVTTVSSFIEMIWWTGLAPRVFDCFRFPQIKDLSIL